MLLFVSAQRRQHFTDSASFFFLTGGDRLKAEGANAKGMFDGGSVLEHSVASEIDNGTTGEDEPAIIIDTAVLLANKIGPILFRAVATFGLSVLIVNYDIISSFFGPGATECK